MATSGIRNFNPTFGEVVVGAYSRCGIRRTELTVQHMSDAQFEGNLLQSSMQGDGILLYEVVLQTQDIIAGVGVYDIDPTMVFTMDVYIRQNGVMQGVRWANDTPYPEYWSNAGGSTMTWVSTPGYNPTGNAPTSANWANQNGINSPWANVGSNIIPWSGVFTPQPIPPVPPAPPLLTSPNAIDRIIIPISRTDYASIANKGMTGFPTSYWLDRLLAPKMYLWPVPNQDIPNGLQYYIQQRPQNAELNNGTQLQIPYEVQDYFTWALAERLAFIYAPDKAAMIAQRKQQAWQMYLQVGTENVPITLNTMVGTYFRV